MEQQLKALGKENLGLVRETFAKCRHVRFLKEFFRI